MSERNFRAQNGSYTSTPKMGDGMVQVFNCGSKGCSVEVRKPFPGSYVEVSVDLRRDAISNLRDWLNDYLEGSAGHGQVTD